MPKALTGRVVSTRMAKTAVVVVDRLKMHPLYKKATRRSKRLYVDNQLDAKEGDMVRVLEARPLSKLKRWKVSQIVKQFTG